MNIPGITLLLLIICCSILIAVFKTFTGWLSVSIALAAFSLFAIIYLGWFEVRYVRGFAQIHKADSKVQVINLMGHPQPIVGYCQGNRACYRSFFFPSIWCISFDRQNRMVKKMHLISY